uniref:Uncharacterized protein n=1 Tax=Cucumis melo TaxID=3656 RepID=A0A9I9ELD3_CUCME
MVNQISTSNLTDYLPKKLAKLKRKKRSIRHFTNNQNVTENHPLPERTGDRTAQTLQLKDQVVDGIKEDIKSNGARSKESLPPPSPIFHTEMHVDARKDKEEFDEKGSKGKGPSSKNEKPRWILSSRNFPRNLVSSNGKLNFLCSCAKESSKQGEWHRYAKPESQEFKI